jgi:pimeloyl-ACP methyl ester carboxylesterase
MANINYLDMNAQPRLPNARIAALDDEPATGHYPQLENPGAVAELLAAFLREDAPRAGGGQA